MRGRMMTGLALLLMLLAAPATGQPGAPPVPDPASVTVPALTGLRDPAVVKDGAKYYVFWRADTSFQQAYADIADCARFTPMAAGNAALLPMFIAWRGKPEARDDSSPPSHPYGLVGDVMGALIMGSATQLAAQGRLHACLAPLGYQRFPIPKATWKVIAADASPAAIAVRAKIASGPRPDADPLEEAL